MYGRTSSFLPAMFVLVSLSADTGYTSYCEYASLLGKLLLNNERRGRKYRCMKGTIARGVGSSGQHFTNQDEYCKLSSDVRREFPTGFA